MMPGASIDFDYANHDIGYPGYDDGATPNTVENKNLVVPKGTRDTFVGYVAAPGTIDASNANTPGEIDPTNADSATPTYRAVAQVGASQIVLTKELGETIVPDQDRPIWNWPAR